MLDATGQRRAHGDRVGYEWFVTSLDALDAVAAAMGLEVRRVNEPVEPAEESDFFGGRVPIDDEQLIELVAELREQLLTADGQEPSARAVTLAVRQAGYRTSIERVRRHLAGMTGADGPA